MKKTAPKPFNGEYPKIPDGLGTFYVAVTMFIMAYSFLFKLFPILIFLALWFSHLYYKKIFILRLSKDLMFVLVFPLLCCYSALWSDAPMVSLYAGLALISMVGSAVIMVRTVRKEAFMKGVTLGVFLVLAATLIKGDYADDAFGSHAALVGLFRSKNEVGFFAEVGIYTSVLILFSKITRREKLLFGVAPMLISLVSIVLCKSASSELSLLIVLSITFCVYLMHRISPSYRALTVSLGLIAFITLVFVIAVSDVNLIGPLLKVFNKDTTLTGRTYLWGEGIKHGMKEPYLGHGYYAFWQVGNPDAEKYWRMFGIPNKTGFHFHNLFIQTFVDFGVFGLSVMSFIILYSCYKSVRACVRSGVGLETGYALGMSFLFLVRAFAEVDLFGPFGIGPLLYFSILPRLASSQQEEELAKKKKA